MSQPAYSANSSAYLRRGQGGGEINLPIAPGQDEVAIHGHGGVRDDRLGEVHHRLVIAIRLVEFDHREFGVMRAVDPLIPKDAADFIDLFHAAHHQPLQMQLERDPQEQIHVERVVMRDERPRRCAAGDGVQHGRFDLGKAAPAERLPHRIDDPRAAEHFLQHAVVVDQVDVPLPQQHFDIFGPMKFLRGLGQRLRQEGHLVDADRHFAGVRQLQMAVDADQIAEVDAADHFPLLVSEVGLREHQLNPPGPVLQVEELELPLVVAEHDPAGETDFGADDPLFGRTQLAGFANRAMAVEALAPGIDAEFLEPMQFLETGRFQTIGRVR
jgi:hypothetical protein